MQGKLALLVAAGFLLAGCVGTGSSTGTDNGGQGPAAPQDADIEPDKGIVQGMILDEEQRPVEGASVQVRGFDQIATTDAEGKFRLINIMPGPQTLDVGRLGYQTIARQLEIVAGQTVELTILLTAIEVTSEVYAEVFRFVGFFECALGTSAWISSCSYPYTAVWGTAKENGVNLSSYGAPQDIQKNTHRFNFTVKPGIEELVVEMTWQPASAAATRMLLMHLCGDYDYVYDECKERHRYGPGNGYVNANPIQGRIEGKQFEKGCPGSKFCVKKGPIWVMAYAGLPFGNPQLAFQQKIEIFDSAFYNGPAPEDYTQVMDK